MENTDSKRRLIVLCPCSHPRPAFCPFVSFCSILPSKRRRRAVEAQKTIWRSARAGMSEGSTLVFIRASAVQARIQSHQNEMKCLSRKDAAGGDVSRTVFDECQVWDKLKTQQQAMKRKFDKPNNVNISNGRHALATRIVTCRKSCPSSHADSSWSSFKTCSMTLIDGEV